MSRTQSFSSNLNHSVHGKASARGESQAYASHHEILNACLAGAMQYYGKMDLFVLVKQPNKRLKCPSILRVGRILLFS